MTRDPVLAYDRRARLLLGLATAAGFLAAVLLVGVIILLARVIDRVFIDGASLGDVAGLLVAMVVLLVLRATAIAVGDVVAQRASTRVKRAVRRRLLDHLFALGPTWTAGERSGELARTVGDSVEDLDGYLTSFLPARALAGLVPVLVFIVILVIDPWSSLVLVFAGPMLLLLLALIGGRTKAVSERRFREMGWLSAFFLDMLQGLGTLKAFGRAEEEAGTIEAVSRRHGDTTMEVLRTAFQTSLVMEWAATAATALVAVEVGFRLVANRLTFGPALAVLVLTPEFFIPLRRMALEYHAGTTGKAATERITAVLDAPVPHPTAPTGSRPAPVPGTVELRDVHVTYPGAAAPALRGASLSVRPGETVALVGASGAGKTTVARLLLRFLEPDAGEVRVAGVPLTSCTPDDWRRRVAWVPQHPYLVNGTVAENIRLADPGATEADVRTAAERANAAAFIDELPRGFDTPTGERGLRLSGGQRQRIAIARAFLRDAPLLVLDEFTAHLDPDSEAAVLDAMGRLVRGRTALVIAHRPVTAGAADRVVVLDGGVVVAEGPPHLVLTSGVPGGNGDHP